HAFLPGQRGTITLAAQGGSTDPVMIVVSDNGVGLPPGLDWKTTKSLGLRLVNNLVVQLGGTIERGPEKGCCFRVVLPKTSGKPAVRNVDQSFGRGKVP
ncbi:MAG: sensor histidine kinase, partial [Methanoregula sp.]|nr:sensor histidine kinase [Methanoregula sp.]